MNTALRPNVFVTHENPSLNYLPAEQFGNVLFLSRDDFSPVKSSLNNEAIVRDIRARLKSFDPTVDFIVVSGSPAVSAAVFMILRELTPRVTVLRWSNRDRAYQPIFIDLTQP